MLELVERAKMGDKPAFDEIIRKSVPDLFRIAMSILRNKDDADDAVCETVVKAYENISKLNDCSLFKTWIIRILINQANTAYKRRKKIVYLNDAQKEPSYEDVYDLGNSELSTAVAGLKFEFRTVITLHYFQDMKVREIASVLKIPEGTVKWRLSKAKDILQEKLSGKKEGLKNGTKH